MVSVISNVRIDEVLVLIKLTDSFLSVLDAVLIIGAWSGPILLRVNLYNDW